MEIFFISSDRDQKSFDDYFAEMPWQALPYEKRDEKAKLSDAFGVQGIPSFVVLNNDGTVITTEGRGKVMEDPKGEKLPHGWLPQPFNNVNDDPSDLNEETCLVAFGDDSAMYAAVKIVAEEYHEKAGKDVGEMPIRFFSGPDGDVMSQVRNLTSVKEVSKLVLIDIPDDGVFYICEKEAITPQAVRDFLEDYKANKLTRKQLQK
jgi:nucleoredoxin